MTENSLPGHVLDALVPLHHGVRSRARLTIEVRPMALFIQPTLFISSKAVGPI